MPGQLWRVSPALVAAVAAAAGWIVLQVNDVFALGPELPGWPGGMVTLVGVPLAAAAVALAAPPETPLAIAARWFAGLTGLFGAALFAAQLVDRHPSLVAAAPLVLAGSWVLYRWPAGGVALVVAITGFTGALTAYLDAPWNKTIYLVLGGLWGATLYRAASGGLGARRVPLGAAFVALFAFLTGVQVLLAGDLSHALDAFSADHLYMLTVLLIAYAGLSRSARWDLARVVVVLAIAVGSYAVLRMVIGPSEIEREMQSASPFNFVEGELRLSGSLANGSSLAFWTAVAIPFCMAVGLSSTRRWGLAALVACVTCSIALAGTQVRGAMLAAALGAALVLVVYVFARAMGGARYGVAAAVAGLTVVIGASALGVAGVNRYETHSLQSLFAGDDVSRSVREYKLSQTFHDLQDRPFGYGLGTAATAYGRGADVNPAAATGVAQASVDSAYLKIALEQGPWMMVLFIVALAALVAGLCRRTLAERDRAAAGLTLAASGAAAALTVALVAGAFTEGPQSLFGWIVVGLGLAELTRRQARVGPGSAE